MTESIYTSVYEVNHRHPISVSGVLKYLAVSRSGYYDWMGREASSSLKRKVYIQDVIQDIYDESSQIYGAPKIHKELLKKHIRVSERTVTRYMHEMEIKACYVRPYTVTTISRDFSSRLQNILNEEFYQEKPNAVWCTDITYIHTKSGFMYLSCIMDLFSRKIISWTLSKTLETKGVTDAVKKAFRNRKGQKPKILHTDRGIQYISEEYMKVTEGIKTSYSAKAYPWDNACIESFHALIKREWLNRFHIRDYDQAYSLIFEYIDTFYNTRRSHSHCGYLAPQEFEDMYYQSHHNQMIQVA